MKKITLSILFAIFALVSSIAQDYTTPNTGVVWTLADIAAASPTTIAGSGYNYTLSGNLTIAENDTLLIDSILTLSIDAGLRITVFGSFIVASNQSTFTATDPNAPYDGFRFEDNSIVNIQNATFTYGGGLRVLTENFNIMYSTLSHNVSGTTSSAVIQLSKGKPGIYNCEITFNENPAIGSAANAQVSAIINGNHIEGNNQANSNRPQINLGVTIPSETLQIVNNTIIGDPNNEMAGGIALANFMGGNMDALIAQNTIRNNRYGIAILGANANVEISYNIIEDNNTQGDPGLGGSGINVISGSSSMTLNVVGNEIRRNLWGITLQDQAVINLGNELPDGGNNTFSENGNGGVIYALYNNTPNTIMAKNNCWIEGQESTAQDVENVIFHQVDDATLGEVIFDPFLCGITTGVEEFSLADFSFYPNPVKNEINFNNRHSIEKVEIYGLQGNLISSEEISEGFQSLPVNLPSGLYFVNFSNKSGSITKKMIVE